MLLNSPKTPHLLLEESLSFFERAEKCLVLVVAEAALVGCSEVLDESTQYVAKAALQVTHI